MNFNKLGLVVLSASAIFMATSCNKGDTKVTEEEFNNAISFKDVDYLQAKITTSLAMPPVMEGDDPIKTSNTISHKMSPNISYIVDTTKVDGKETEYVESYATASGDKVKYIKRESRKGNFEDEVECPISECEYYMTPQDLDLTERLALYGVQYSDFTYKNDAYVISDTQTSEGVSITTTIKACFLNKKITRLKFSMKSTEAMSMDMGMDATLSYSKVVPANPKK